MLQTLAPEVVNLIAAGEVIDSSLAVVRELVENALDAQADRITIRLWLSQWHIEVLDNGRGMDKTTLVHCADPHTTSKITDLDDLQQISTLGFRGEALHGLARVSRLQIASRTTAATDCGWQQAYPRSDQRPLIVPIAAGTRVEVKDLFAQLPQRRQALGNFKRQVTAVQQYVQRLAVGHPQVTWQVWSDERLKLKLSPATTPEAMVLQCLPTLQASDLTTVHKVLPLPETVTDSFDSTAQLTLTLAYPDRYHRHRPDWLLVMVNGRPVQCPELEQTVLGSFHRSLPRSRYPVCICQWQLPPELIDWHRHPAKTELYLQHLSHWQAHLKQGLEAALPLTPTTPSRAQTLFKAAESSSSYQLEAPHTSLTDAILPKPLSLKAIAQVSQTYIVVEHERGVWLVEQHVAHERVLFEQLQAHWQCERLSQPLILSQFNAKQIERLQEFGIEIDLFGEETYAVRCLPDLVQQLENPSDFLRELSQLSTLATAQAAIACRSAIKNGQPLSASTYQSLITRWQQCQHPQTCPHGRPIYLPLDEKSLARFFRRNWLIQPNSAPEK